MALKWSISHDDRLVVFQVTDRFVAAEVQSALAALITEGALPYRKLFDARFASHDPNGADLRWLSNLVLSVAKTVTLGPVAFVSNLDSAADIVDHFSRKTAVDRPLRIFRDIASARRWLDDIGPTMRPKDDGC